MLALSLPRAVSGLGLAALIVSAPVGARAHEVGKTKVDTSFGPSGAFAVRLTTDAEVLLGRLEVSRRRPRSSPSSIAAYQRQFDEVCDQIAAHAGLSFDGRPVELRPVCVVDPELTGPDPSLSALGVTVTFEGQIPPGSASFTWRYDLTFTTYSLASASPEGQDPSVVWLEGGQESRPLPIVRVVERKWPGLLWTSLLPGFTHVLPRGLDHVLLVLGLALLGWPMRRMVWQLSAFTIAHAAGLTLSIVGPASVAPTTVEPLMALAVVSVAALNIRAVEPPSPGFVTVLLLGVGFLHGAGVGGWLGSPALDRAGSLFSILAPTAGLWLGQLAVLVGVVLVVGGPARADRACLRAVAVPASIILAAVGIFWTLQRLPL